MPRPRRSLLCAALVAIALPLLDARQPSPAVAPPSVRFAAIGDMGTGNSAQYEVARMMAARRRAFPFDFVIMLGDNLYGGDSPADYARQFELPYKLLLDAGVTFYASLGNHDGPNQRVYTPFHMNGQPFYTFTKGNAQFFALDSNYLAPEQLAWLEQGLQASTADWKICFFHHPLYSSGTFHGSSLELRAVLEPLFVKYGVQVVFAGHEHVYERLKPQHGVNYFIEGASGQLRRGNLRRSSALTAAGYDQDRSFMLVDITGDSLAYQAVSRTDQTVDSGTIRRAALTQ